MIHKHIMFSEPAVCPRPVKIRRRVVPLLKMVFIFESQSLGTIMMQVPYEKVCNEMYKFDRRVRYAVILDETGRQIAGGMRRGIPSLEPQSEDLRLIANITIQLSTDKTWDRYFGRSQYTFIKREKVSILTFSIGNKLLMVSTEPDFTLQQAQDLRNQIVTNHAAEFG
ncbi:MAG: DUF6659 family protein [Nitrososphaerales archaeon]|jgi:hypothetical protein